MKKIIMALAMLMLAVLPMMALAAHSDIYIGDVLLNADVETAQYTFDFTDGVVPTGVLTLKNGASLGEIEAGRILLTIHVPSGATADIAYVRTVTMDGLNDPQVITIKGGGTLNLGGLSAGNGLGIYDGTTVNVNKTSPGSAVFVQRGAFGVYGGSTLNAVSSNPDDGVIVLMDAAFFNITGGSVVRASGGKYGVRNYRWGSGSTKAPCDITVSGNSTLDLSAINQPLINRYWDQKNKGKIRLEDTSTLRMAGDLRNLEDTNTEFPASYVWRTTSGGSWNQYPYSQYGNLSGGTYLEIQGNSVFAPQLSPDSAQLMIDESQTFTVSSANGAAASGVSYQWYVNDSAVSGATGASYTFTPQAGGKQTVRCDVTVSGLGMQSLTAKVTVDNDLSDRAEISNPAYLWRDSFAPTVTWNGRTLVHGTDYTVKTMDSLMGTSFERTLEPNQMLTMDSGTYTLTVTFIGKYSGSKTAEMTIGKVPLEKVNAAFVPDSFEYNGQNQYPTSYTAEYKGYELRRWSYASSGDVQIFMPAAGAIVGGTPTIEPGTYQDTIHAADSSKYFTGSKTMTYTIKPGAPAVNPPEGLTAYYSQKLGDVALPEAEGGAWSWVNPDALVGDVGANVHKAVFTPEDTARYYAVEKDVTVTVVRADTAYGALDVYNGSVKTTNFVYGDTVTVKAKPEPVRPAGFVQNLASSLADRQMALFIGDTQISDAVSAGADGVYTMTVDTADKALAIGENTVTAKYAGWANMADYSENVTITLSRKPLGIVSITAEGRDYEPGNAQVVVTGVTLSGVEGADDVSADCAGLKAALDSEDPGEYAQAQLPAELTLDGADKGYYSIAGAGVTVSPAVKIDKATPAYTVPEGLKAYYGQKLGDIALPQAAGGAWTWENESDPVGEAGVRTHAARFTPADTERYRTMREEIALEVVRADTAYGMLDVYNGDAQTTDFVYGDIVTVKAKPVPVEPVGFMRNMFSAVEENQMALFIGDTQISAAADADADGVYTMNVNTADKALVIGENEIAVRYVGTANMADYSRSVIATLSAKPLTVVRVSALDRCYNSDETWVKLTGAEFDGKVLESDDVRLAEGQLGTLSGDAIGTYSEVTLPDPLLLAGEHAAYYSAAGGTAAAVSVRITEVPDDLMRKLIVRAEYTEADIPDTLRRAGLRTVSAIRERLIQQIRRQDSDAEGMLLYNLTLMYSEDGGSTWIRAEKEHFPKSGKLRVELPVPAVTDGKTFEYSAAHMFTDEARGHKPGQIETPAIHVVTGEDGQLMLSFEVTGLSPVMIGWSHLKLNLPGTGDDSALVLWLALAALSGAALLVMRRRREDA